MKPQTQITKLNDVAEVKSGFAFKSSEYSKEGIPIIRISNITQGENVEILKKNQYYYNLSLDEKQSNVLLKKNDILIALSGATTGKIGIYKTNHPALLNQRIALIRSKDEKSNNYIYYFLQTKSQQILKEAYGGAQPNISPNSLKEYEIYYPKKFEEREKIVSAIETQFIRLDEAIKSLKAVKQKIEVYRKAVLKKAFEKGKGWEEKKIGEVCEVVRGGSPRPAGDPKYYGGNIPFLKVADLTKDNNKFLDSFTYTIKEAGLFKTRKIIPNTLLLTNSGATLGVPKICIIEATMNDGIAAFLNLNDETQEYLYYFLLSKTKEMRNINQGAAQPNLNTNIIKNILVPFPPSIPTQSQIVSQIESKFSVIDEVEKIVDGSLKKTEMLKKSILKSAFEGRLVKER